jgi:glutathione S-transferase
VITVYGTSDSGNCYKVKLAAEQLRMPYRWVEVDSVKGETRTPEFLARNANGKVPTVQLENGAFLPESNAILHYLADGTPLLPGERLAHARVLQWMFFEQYSHEPYIAVARFWRHFLDRPVDDERMDRGRQALGVMERHLARRRFFVDDRYSIADVALYAYTHVADEGGFDLAPHPAVRAWLARVAAEPGHVPIGWRP